MYNQNESMLFNKNMMLYHNLYFLCSYYLVKFIFIFYKNTFKKPSFLKYSALSNFSFVDFSNISRSYNIFLNYIYFFIKNYFSSIMSACHLREIRILLNHFFHFLLFFALLLFWF